MAGSRARAIGTGSDPAGFATLFGHEELLHALIRDGRTLHLPNVHDAWPLQAAEAEIELASISPLELDDPPLCHFSRRQDVLVWPLESLH